MGRHEASKSARRESRTSDGARKDLITDSAVRIMFSRSWTEDEGTAAQTERVSAEPTPCAGLSVCVMKCEKSGRCIRKSLSWRLNLRWTGLDGFSVYNHASWKARF